MKGHNMCKLNNKINIERYCHKSQKPGVSSKTETETFLRNILMKTLKRYLKRTILFYTILCYMWNLTTSGKLLQVYYNFLCDIMYILSYIAKYGASGWCSLDSNDWGFQPLLRCHYIYHLWKHVYINIL